MRYRNLFLAAALSVPMAIGAQTMDGSAASDAGQPDVQPSSAAGASVSDEAAGFQTLDDNEDGFISRDEASGTYLAPRFDALDTDHDGQLSPSEVAAGSPAAAGAGVAAAPQ